MRKIIKLSRHDFEEIYFRLQNYLTTPYTYDECNEEAIKYINENIHLGDLNEELSYVLVTNIVGLDLSHSILLNKEKSKLMYMGVMRYIDVQSMHFDEFPRLITRDEFIKYTKFYETRMGIEKKLFVETINILKEQLEHDNKCVEAFNTILPSDYVVGYDNGRLYDQLIKILQQLTDDQSENGLIEYFIWELDFGKKYKKGCLKIHNKDVDISTPEKLYETLKKYNKHE